MTTTTATTLDELLADIRQQPHADWAWDALPVFGGAAPSHTTGVWSWDATRLLIGDDVEQLEIVPREEGGAL